MRCYERDWRTSALVGSISWGAVRRQFDLAAPLAIAAVFCLIAMWARAQTVVEQSGFEIGVGGHYAPQQTKDFADYSLAQMRDLGVTSYRQDFFWEWLEQQKGHREIGPRLAMLDKFIKDVRQQGIDPLIVLAYGNDLYDARGFPLSPEAQDGFVAYATAIATRYKGIVTKYELWNEWNGGAGSKPRRKWGDSVDYAQLLGKVYAALKAVDPHIIVIGGATSGIDVNWAKVVWRAGGLKVMDGFSMHPYGYPGIPERIMERIDSFESEARRAADGREVPIYITEIGWPTHKGDRGTDPVLAADYLTRFYLLAATRPYIKGVWWYDLFDDGNDVGEPEHNFGLIHRPTPKPAACAMTQVSKLLTAFKPVSANREPNGTWVLKLNKGNEFTYAIWVEERGSTRSVTIHPSSGNAAITAKGTCREAAVTGQGDSVKAVITNSPLLLSTKAADIAIE